VPNTKDVKRFQRHVKERVRLYPYRDHGWQNHFKGVVAEVIGYLEMMAKRDPFRQNFVWSRIDDIIEHCNKGGREKYSRRSVEYALTFLRRLWIISGVVERQRPNGHGEVQLFAGRIVTPHEAFCERRKHVCFYSFYSTNRLQKGHTMKAQKITGKNFGRKSGGVLLWYGGKKR
jgi:hypothetical protein